MALFPAARRVGWRLGKWKASTTQGNRSLTCLKHAHVPDLTDEEIMLYRSSCKLGISARAEAPTIFDKPSSHRAALFVGYVGTGYRGSQINLSTARGETVEETIMEALFHAGAIREESFLRERQLNWSRSSRTDKSAHALLNVVSTDILVLDTDEWDRDPTGVGFAKILNEYLPDSIRVFSVQRMPKQFQARVFCRSRTYDYLFPAWALGLDGSSSDQDKMEKLQGVLDMYIGRRAFHNYTRRSMYQSRDKNQPPKDDRVDSKIDSGTEESEEEIESRFFASESDKRAPLVLWKHKTTNNDRIVSSHYRNILNAQCFGPFTDGPGMPDLPYVRIRVQGESFVFNQVRHMVGTAIVAVRGNLPTEFIELTMAPPARVNLPIVPADTLILSDTEFNLPPRCPFRSTLQLENESFDLQRKFNNEQLEQSLRSALQENLWGEVINRFEEHFLPRLHCERSMENSIKTYQAWRSQVLSW